MKCYWYSEFPIGTLGIVDDGDGISSVFLKGEREPVGAVKKRTELIIRAEEELREYFNGSRQIFRVPLSLEGTEFQKKVWQALREIPYGETRCYSEIAAAVGNPKASRAVGMANHRNPVMILVPCHRVIGKNGDLTGYAGGLNVKQELLRLENVKNN